MTPIQTLKHPGFEVIRIIGCSQREITLFQLVYDLNKTREQKYAAQFPGYIILFLFTHSLRSCE
jgi:hypothetical protein